MIGCIPPWLASVKEEWCNETLHFTEGKGTPQQVGNIRPIPCPDFRIRIYHFEVNMLMHLNFCDSAVKFFLDHPKKLHWNIELDD